MRGAFKYVPFVAILGQAGWPKIFAGDFASWRFRRIFRFQGISPEISPRGSAAGDLTGPPHRYRRF
eukprot:2856601-Pyramimonas_sp.AAC.1